MNITLIFIPLLLLIVGFLYASVGHGGASGYIAVLSLFSIAASTYKPVVLIINIIVAASSDEAGQLRSWRPWYLSRDS